MSKHKPSAVRFFFSHAGYSYDPATETKIQGRWKTARALAQAEAAGRAANLVFEWQYEQDVDVSWMDEAQLKDYRDGHIEMLCCLCFQDVPNCGMCDTYDDFKRRHNRPAVLASLGNISLGPDDRNYRRVVQAELAAEALSSSEFQDPADTDTPQLQEAAGMTKKDYVGLAKAIAENVEAGYQGPLAVSETAHSIANYCERENPRGFDRELFLINCGINQKEITK